MVCAHAGPPHVSLVYNLAGAALAMSGHIDPVLAAFLMPASSLTVVLASWRGRTFDPPAADETRRGDSRPPRRSLADPFPGGEIP
jgi:hypothetical protein